MLGIVGVPGAVGAVGITPRSLLRLLDINEIEGGAGGEIGGVDAVAVAIGAGRGPRRARHGRDGIWRRGMGGWRRSGLDGRRHRNRLSSDHCEGGELGGRRRGECCRLMLVAALVSAWRAEGGGLRSIESWRRQGGRGRRGGEEELEGGVGLITLS